MCKNKEECRSWGDWNVSSPEAHSTSVSQRGAKERGDSNIACSLHRFVHWEVELCLISSSLCRFCTDQICILKMHLTPFFIHFNLGINNFLTVLCNAKWNLHATRIQGLKDAQKYSRCCLRYCFKFWVFEHSTLYILVSFWPNTQSLSLYSLMVVGIYWVVPLPRLLMFFLRVSTAVWHQRCTSRAGNWSKELTPLPLILFLLGVFYVFVLFLKEKRASCFIYGGWTSVQVLSW